MQIDLKMPADFDFLTAVCSYGFFMLAPNRWEPARGTLHTAIGLDEQRAAAVSLRTGAGRRLRIEVAGRLNASQRDRVIAAVGRMLRLDEDLSGFHARCAAVPTHADAAANRFGRLIRSATLFEDIVKVICTCNVTWRQTVSMVSALVKHWGVPTAGGDGMRAFPTATGLAAADTDELRRLARVGYRAKFIHALATGVADGRIDLVELASCTDDTDGLCRRLKKLPGVGDYAAGNLCMLLGRYDRLAVDTEMLRLMRSRHPRRRFTPAGLHAYYRRWHPYQFLIYWFELWCDYMERHGRSEHWSPDDTGQRITAGRKP